MFKRGNKCSQLNYLRSKTKLIRQQYNEAAVSRPASLVMLSSLSSAVNVAERGEGGLPLCWQLWSPPHCPGEEREQPELKDVGVMFAMKEYCVVTTPHWAFHPPSPPQWFYNFLIQISYLKSPCWSLVTNYPNCPLSCDPGAWCQESHHQPLVTLPPVDVTQLMMERSCV